MRAHGLLLSAAAAIACSTAAEPAPSAAAAVVRLERQWPALSFANPLFVTHAPGEPESLYVVTQPGEIVRLPRGRTAAVATPFLDLRERVAQRGGEEGLLGLAFHPGYARNGWLYVYSTPRGKPRRSRVTRFVARGGRAEAASGIDLLEVKQPYPNHNGGMIAFGPDGMLYVASGDGGSAGDPHGNGQRLDTLLGKILRITPRGGVPRDNPFVATAGARPEIWAYGLRNPWRFSFDRKTGELWAGDVGQNRWEEVDVVVRGGNYGWRRFEGSETYDDGTAAPGALPPVYAYGRGDGQSITGGYVYRGRAIPALAGAYVFGDFGSGRVWALRRDGGRTRVAQIAQAQQLSSFGEDADGELYLCSFDGGVYKLVPP